MGPRAFVACMTAHTAYKQPANGAWLPHDNRAYISSFDSLRGLGERSFVILTGRWHALRHTIASPPNIDGIIRAPHLLT
jgi:hypothetical protein